MASSRAPFVLSASADPANWTVADAARLYNMAGWGLGYFRVSDEGHVTVHPDGSTDQGIDLYQIATDLNAQGVGLPLLLRFCDAARCRWICARRHPRAAHSKQSVLPVPVGLSSSALEPCSSASTTFSMYTSWTG